MKDPKRNERPEPDDLLDEIADYVDGYTGASDEAVETARLVLLDSIACALLALEYPSCRRLLGPVVAGTVVPDGTRVPGTAHELDPIKGAFDIGACIRWLDFNDTWLAAEWGHPSDNLGAILAVTDHRSRQRARAGTQPFTVADVLQAAIKAHEIQGVLALDNSCNEVGLDHVLLVRVASAAVATQLLGGNRDQIRDAVSQAFLDGGALRAYRHAPNTGPRKSWAAGDATSRGVRLALMTLAGEPGYPAPLSTPTWGFHDVAFRGQTVGLAQPLGSYVMENILFKIAFPAEFHGQTAVEAALTLHAEVRDRIDEIDAIVIHTQLPAIRIIDKQGPLHNPADRDHCIQYMTAVGLIHGELTAEHYEDRFADDPRIDRLRDKTVVFEDPGYSHDYLDPTKRSIPNAVQVFFTDGTSTLNHQVHFPLGHRRRRTEARPLLRTKLGQAIETHYPPGQRDEILDAFSDHRALDALPVHELMTLLTIGS